MSNLQMWYNGEFLDADKAQVSLLEHGLHYGTGVFEGIRCYETKKARSFSTRRSPCKNGRGRKNDRYVF